MAMSSQANKTSSEIEWIQKYTSESAVDKSTKKKTLEILFITLPFLKPFSDEFIKFCCLTEPKIELEFKFVADSTINLRFVDAAVCVHEIVLCRERVMTEALAKRSHIEYFKSKK